MDKSKTILAAIDDSEASMKAVTYLAKMVGEQTGFKICLFHVLSPLPPELLEFGGADDPKLEHRLDAQLRKAQERWVKKAMHEGRPVFTKESQSSKKPGSLRIL